MEAFHQDHDHQVLSYSVCTLCLSINLTNKSTIDQLHRAVAQGCPFLCRPGGDFRALSLVESPDLEEPEVTQEEVSTLGREQLHFWSSFLRRSFIFCSTVALIYAAVYSCAPEGSAACRPCCGSIIVGFSGPKGWLTSTPEKIQSLTFPSVFLSLLYIFFLIQTIPTKHCEI